MDSDRIRGREVIQDRADDGGERADRLSRLRGAAARFDSEPSLISAARRFRRRLPGDERFGDPLSTASGRGRGGLEMALLFTDLVGFSSWALTVGDAAVLELLGEVGSAVEARITAHEGRIVKRLGDGLMASFLSAESAVEAALDAHDPVRDIEVGRLPTEEVRRRPLGTAPEARRRLPRRRREHRGARRCRCRCRTGAGVGQAPRPDRSRRLAHRPSEAAPGRRRAAGSACRASNPLLSERRIPARCRFYCTNRRAQPRA